MSIAKHPPTCPPMYIHNMPSIHAMHNLSIAARRLCQDHCVASGYIDNTEGGQRADRATVLIYKPGGLIRDWSETMTQDVPSQYGLREHPGVSFSDHKLFRAHASRSTWRQLCRDRVKGLWLTKPLIPQQLCTLWSASLRGREDQSSPDTSSQWAPAFFPSLSSSMSQPLSDLLPFVCFRAEELKLQLADRLKMLRANRGGYRQ